jgi:MFS superfamily sulfate permease-like transporter
MARQLLVYTLLRLGLLVLIAGVLIVLTVPAVVAVLIGIVLAFALSLVLFRDQRARLDAALAEARTRRRAERQRLRDALRGDERA